MFYWKTRQGDLLKPSEMASGHIYNSIKMIFNNTMPPALRVGPFIRWNDIKYWDVGYRTKALYELSMELVGRKDFHEYKDGFVDMTMNAQFFNDLVQGARPMRPNIGFAVNEGYNRYHDHDLEETPTINYYDRKDYDWHEHDIPF